MFRYVLRFSSRVTFIIVLAFFGRSSNKGIHISYDYCDIAEVSLVVALALL
jgi:hypothetical protein